jgi:predicted amidophosphoribosyltransferase
MYCSRCGAPADEGAHFCQQCGSALQTSDNAAHQPAAYRTPERATVSSSPSRRFTSRRPQDPYKDQIQQLKLEIKKLRLDLKQVTTRMSSIRSRYYETAAFVPRGLLRWGDKAIEDLRLLGPQQQKEYLQQQLMQLEQKLLSLQQAQAEWKDQQ